MKRTRTMAIGVLAAFAPLAAQTPPIGDPIGDSIGDLTSADAAVREAARRAFALRDDLPVADLERLLVHHDPAIVAVAVDLLRDVAPAAAALRALAGHASPAVRAAVVPVLDADALAGLLDDPAPAVRRAAVCTLEDQVGLSDAHLRRALGDDDEGVAETALSIVLHERVPLRATLLGGLQGEARLRVLGGLVDRPRASAAPWLRELVRAGDSVGTQVALLARAALPPADLDKATVRDLVRRSIELGDFAPTYAACARLDSAVADALVGQLHAAVVGDLPIAVALPCLARISPRGEQQLFGLARALDEQAREDVLHWLGARSSVRLGEQIGAALDGDVALEPYLLRRSGEHLDRAARVERVVAKLAPGEPASVRQFAFSALVHGQRFDPAMLTFALEDPEVAPRRLQLLLRVPIERFPAAALLQLLEHERFEVRKGTCNALAGAPYPESVERRLVALVREDPPVAAAATRALIAFGSEAVVRSVWEHLDRRQRIGAAAALGGRRHAWVPGLLADTLARLDAEPLDDEDTRQLRGELLLALADLERGRAVDRLVARLGELSLRTVRRANERLIADLQPRHAADLRRCLTAPQTDEDVQLEILGWLAQRPDLDLRADVRALFESSDSEEVRYEARRALLAGPGAAPFYAELRERLTRFGEDERDLAHEVIGTLRAPVGGDALDLLARLLLLAPLGDPRGEAAQSLLGPPRSADFPLHHPVVDLLRRLENVSIEPFAAVAAEVRRHPHRAAVTGRRFGHLLVGMATWSSLRAGIAPIVARLLLEAPERDLGWRAAAELILAEAAQRAERFDEAEERYARAVRGLLRTPPAPLVRRALLGDSAVRGTASARLAVQPFLMRARAALTQDDPTAARAALTLAADLVVGEDELSLEVAELRERTQR